MSTELDLQTIWNCKIDLEQSYGRFAVRRFSRLIEIKEATLNKKLNREQILELYNQFAVDLCKERELKTS